MNAIAPIGHNNPPEPTPFEMSSTTIADLYEEAKGWLDGEPVKTKAMADALNTLETRVRAAAKELEINRKAEAKPFDDGKAEVQARYKPVSAKADDALAAIKSALKPYLLELDRQQQEAARIAREEAAAKHAAAMEAMRQRDAANLAEREEADRLVKEAKAAEDAARKAETVKAHAKGEGRATGLRTVHRAVLVNTRDAAAWVWKDRYEELCAFIQDQADKAVRSGVRTIPGYDIVEEKVL
jgi:hypothetical protein